MLDWLYWARAASRAYSEQALDLETARLNPRGSKARQAWLESARVSSSRKRMYRRFHDEHCGACLLPIQRGDVARRDGKAASKRA